MDDQNKSGRAKRSKPSQTKDIKARANGCDEKPGIPKPKLASCCRAFVDGRFPGYAAPTVASMMKMKAAQKEIAVCHRYRLAIPVSCSIGGTAMSTPKKVPSKPRSKDLSQKKLLNSHKPADFSGAKKEKEAKMAACSDKLKQHIAEKKAETMKFKTSTTESKDAQKQKSASNLENRQTSTVLPSESKSYEHHTAAGNSQNRQTCATSKSDSKHLGNLKDAKRTNSVKNSKENHQIKIDSNKSEKNKEAENHDATKHPKDSRQTIATTQSDSTKRNKNRNLIASSNHPQTSALAKTETEKIRTSKDEMEKPKMTNSKGHEGMSQKFELCRHPAKEKIAHKDLENCIDIKQQTVTEFKQETSDNESHKVSEVEDEKQLQEKEMARLEKIRTSEEERLERKKRLDAVMRRVKVDDSLKSSKNLKTEKLDVSEDIDTAAVKTETFNTPNNDPVDLGASKEEFGEVETGTTVKTEILNTPDNILIDSGERKEEFGKVETGTTVETSDNIPVDSAVRTEEYAEVETGTTIKTETLNASENISIDSGVQAEECSISPNGLEIETKRLVSFGDISINSNKDASYGMRTNEDPMTMEMKNDEKMEFNFLDSPGFSNFNATCIPTSLSPEAKSVEQEQEPRGGTDSMPYEETTNFRVTNGGSNLKDFDDDTRRKEEEEVEDGMKSGVESVDTAVNSKNKDVVDDPIDFSDIHAQVAICNSSLSLKAVDVVCMNVDGELQPSPIPPLMALIADSVSA